MIELNLLEKKKPLQLPSVLGIDLNVVSFKMLGVAFFMYYVPEWFVQGHFESAIKDEETQLQKLTDDFTKISKEVAKNINIKAQLDAYNKQVDKLKTRSSQVEEILKIRTNPKKVLEKIARTIPEDLWFDQLKISENRDVVITGGAYSARSVGEFITIINESPFFANSLTPVKQENKQETLDGVVGSHEVFELRGKIKNYELRSR